MTEPLSTRKAEILAVLKRHPEGLGFNELSYEVSGFAARQTVKNELDELIRLGLVEKHAGRRGQKVYYVYKSFAEVYRSIEIHIEALSLVLRGLRRGIERIEKKLGKSLEDITNADDFNPVREDLIDLMTRAFPNACMLVYIVESRFPFRLRERFVKEVEEPLRDLLKKVARPFLLDSRLSQELNRFIEERETEFNKRFERNFGKS